MGGKGIAAAALVAMVLMPAEMQASRKETPSIVQKVAPKATAPQKHGKMRTISLEERIRIDPLDTFSPSQYLAPPPPPESLDPLLNAHGAPVTSVTHSLFGTQTTEELPGIQERVAMERYLRASVRSDTIVFFDGYRPYASFRLTDEFRTRKIWDAANEDERRSIMKLIGAQLSKQMKKDLGVKELNWRIGHADTLARAIREYSPFARYFEQLASERQLDSRSAMLAFHETNWRNFLTSSASCEGYFQLSRGTAWKDCSRSYACRGIRVPTTVKKGKVVPLPKGGNDTQVNESLHPILAAEAALDTLRDYAREQGSMIISFGSYNAGPGRTRTALKFVRQHPTPAKQEASRTAEMAAKQYFGGTQTALTLWHAPPKRDDATKGSAGKKTTKERTPMEEFSQLINEAWKRMPKSLGYGTESSSYVPKVLGYFSAVRIDPQAKPFATDRIRVQYSPGATALTGAQAALAFASADEFRKYNPHIPLVARIHERTSIFLPPGKAEEFYRRQPMLVQQEILAYSDGQISRKGAVQSAKVLR